MVCTSVSPALRRWRQEYYKFKASQGYTDPVSKKKKNQKPEQSGQDGGLEASTILTP
jgi:hypothetical protein